MEYSSLYDFIKYLQYGTNLHIGVLFLGNYGNEKCILPFEQTIHASKICDEFKSYEGNMKKCFRCRNAAINKAISTKKDFAGLCINGVYEYTRPVVIDGDVVCVFFIGNILEETQGIKKLTQKLRGNAHLIDTLEKDFKFDKCKSVADLIETYIRTLLKNISATYQDNFNPLIENIKNYIVANLEYDIKISQIAKTFQYNEQYLGRVFKKETKMSVSSYITTKRLERAKKLLKETNHTIIDIAFTVGFNNVTYFNRIFKRHLDMTPQQFRTKSITKGIV